MNLKTPTQPMPGAIECVLAALEKQLPLDPIAEARVDQLADKLKTKPRRPWRDTWGKADV